MDMFPYISVCSFQIVITLDFPKPSTIRYKYTCVQLFVSYWFSYYYKNSILGLNSLFHIGFPIPTIVEYTGIAMEIMETN